MKQSQFYYLLRRGLFGGGGIWAKYVNDFKARVIADGGTMESPSCLTADVKFLVQNPEPVAFTGLLNDYSGAAAAYSLRLLDNTYTGDAIVVRRASDNTTQAIGFVNNELDTTSLESFCSGTDGFVTTWYDQSGNSLDATQTTAGNQPQIVLAGTSLGYVKTFNTQRLLNSSNLWLNGVDYSVFGVMKSNGQNLFVSGDFTGYAAVAAMNNTSTSTQEFIEGNRYKNGSLIGNTWGDIYNATTSFSAMSILVSSTTIKGISLGGRITTYNDSELKEYIIYPNQSVSRTGVENNIITHYGF